MARATGVASYAMQTAAAAAALGHRIEGVFGLSVPDDPTLRESAFFDGLNRPVDPPRKTSRCHRALYFVRAFRSPRARSVPLTAQVEKLAFAATMPPFDRVVTVGRLFEDAYRSFKATHRFVSLRLDDPPDIMHWTYPIPVSIKGIPNIYTLHDLVPLKFPNTTLDNKKTYGRIVANCIAMSAQICTVSESSKRDIVERFGLDPTRVTNTYQATSMSEDALHYAPAAAAHAVEGIFGLPRRGYFVYFGAIEPKKNVGRLIEAYLSLQSTTPLVIVGARAWRAEQELRLMPEGGASGEAGTYRGHRGQTIMRLDYLPRELLAKLVRGAKALVFPSLYEGFGLPVLEAMQLGTPVITSNTSSLPEVAGDAALLVDPYDVAELQEAMRRVDTDAALCAAMSERGIERAKLFSRERYQQRLTELYAAAMAPR